MNTTPVGATMTQATDLEQTAPQKVVEALRNALGERLIAIVLFGSRARGDHRPESDWDLLVVARELPENLLDRGRFLNEALPLECRGSVSVIARTPGEFEDHVPSLYLDIALDGRILCDPSGYTAQRLGRLRRLIEEAGLSREQTGAGHVWRWKKQPRGRWAMSWEKIGETT